MPLAWVQLAEEILKLEFLFKMGHRFVYFRTFKLLYNKQTWKNKYGNGIWTHDLQNVSLLS